MDWIGLILLFGVLGYFYFLIFKEQVRQDLIQRRRLVQLEELVKLEIKRSQTLENQVSTIHQIKTKTEEKLELIRLMLEALRKNEPKN